MFSVIATEEDIAAGYRLILGREPDPEGMRVYAGARLPVEAVIRSLIASPEYQARAQAIKTVRIHGHGFAVRANETMYEYEENYEPWVFHPLMRLLGPGKRFLDAGANIGLFAIHGALRGAEVIAIEPRPSNASLLLENARRSGVSVELHPLAVSDHHGYAVLDTAPENENAAIRRLEANSLGDQITALAILDELIGERHIDVMKIDIEGHEYKAMLGAGKMLSRSHPVIVTEYHPDSQQDGSGVPGSVYLGYLEEFGYNRITILLRSGELKPAGDTAAIDELCRNQGYHADLLLEPCCG